MGQRRIIPLWALLGTLALSCAQLTEQPALPPAPSVLGAFDDLTGDPMLHPGSITALAFSFDGRQLASGDARGVVQVWDISRGELTRRYRPSSATAAATAAATRWFETGRVPAALDDTIANVNQGAGPTLDLRFPLRQGALSIVDAMHGLIVLDLNKPGAAHRGAPTLLGQAAAIGLDGRQAVVSTRPPAPSRLELWTAGAEVVELDFDSARATDHLTWSVTGTLVGLSGTRLRCWSATSGKASPCGTPLGTTPRALDPDGDWVLVSSPDGGMAVVRPNGADLIQLTHPSVEGGLAVDVYNDGEIIAIADAGGIWVWRGAEQAPRLLATLDRPQRNLRLSLDGTLLAAGGEDRLVRVWRLDSGQLLMPQGEIPEAPHAIGVTADRRWIVVGGESGALWSMDTSTGIRRCTLDSETEHRIRLGTHPTRPLAVSSSARSRRLMLWDLDRCEGLGTLRAGDRVLSAAFTGAQGAASAITRGGKVRAWSTDDQQTQPLNLRLGDQYEWQRAFFQADGTGAAGVTRDGLVRARVGGQPHHQPLAPGPDRVLAVDGELSQALAYGIADKATPGGVQIWDLDDGRPRASLVELTGAQLQAARFLSGGRRLVTLQQADGLQVALWDTEDGALLDTAPAGQPGERGAGLALYPDDSALVIGTTSGRIRVFPLLTVE